MTLRAHLPWWLVLATFLTFAGSPAFGEEYDEETIAAVNDHFARGAELYYAEQYDAAIVEFEAAHAKIPNAIFLFNISLAQAKKGEIAASLEAAERAEEMGGLGPDDQVQNRARIAALRRHQQSQQAAADIEARIAEEEKVAVKPLLNFSVLGWTGAGLAVAGVLGLSGVAIIDGNLSNRVESYKAAAASGDVERYEQLRDDIRGPQRAGRILFVLSSVTFATGVGLLVYDIFIRDTGAEVSLVPAPGGVAIIGRF